MPHMRNRNIESAGAPDATELEERGRAEARSYIHGASGMEVLN